MHIGIGIRRGRTTHKKLHVDTLILIPTFKIYVFSYSRQTDDDCRFCHSRRRFLVDCCLTHHCHCSANAFANAATSRRAFASHSPGWLSRGFSSRHNLLTCHRLSTRRLVVESPLSAPPSHFPRLIVTSPLFALPLLLNAHAAAPRRVIASPRVGASNSLSPFVKNNPPPPAGFSF